MPTTAEHARLAEATGSPEDDLLSATPRMGGGRT